MGAALPAAQAHAPAYTSLSPYHDFGNSFSLYHKIPKDAHFIMVSHLVYLIQRINKIKRKHLFPYWTRSQGQHRHLACSALAWGFNPTSFLCPVLWPCPPPPRQKETITLEFRPWALIFQ